MRLLKWLVGLTLAGLWVLNEWEEDWLVVLTIYVVLVAPSTRRARPGVGEFHGAPIAVGTVLEASRTGRVVRGHPELDLRLQVHTADGRSFTATTRRVVAVDELPAVVPDARVVVRYLADGRVSVAWDASDQEVQAATGRVDVAKEWF